MIPALQMLWKVWCFLRQGFSLGLGWFVGVFPALFPGMVLASHRRGKGAEENLGIWGT